MRFAIITMLLVSLAGCMEVAGPKITNSMDKQVTVTVTYKTGRIHEITFDPCKISFVGHPDDMVASVSFNNSIVKMPYSDNDELAKITNIHVFEDRLLTLPTSACIPTQQQN